MLPLNLKAYRKYPLKDKEILKEKVFAEIRTFPKTPPKRDLAAHLCSVLDLSFSMAQMFIMLYDQQVQPIGRGRKVGLETYLSMNPLAKDNLKNKVFTFYYENYDKNKMTELKKMAATKFNLSKHLIKGIAPKAKQLKESGMRLPSGDII